MVYQQIPDCLGDCFVHHCIQRQCANSLVTDFVYITLQIRRARDTAFRLNCIIPVTTNVLDSNCVGVSGQSRDDLTPTSMHVCSACGRAMLRALPWTISWTGKSELFGKNTFWFLAEGVYRSTQNPCNQKPVRMRMVK